MLLAHECPAFNGHKSQRTPHVAKLAAADDLLQFKRRSADLQVEKCPFRGLNGSGTPDRKLRSCQDLPTFAAGLGSNPLARASLLTR